MTQATPPGWYPDPGQTSDGPATERWWDGTTWTDQTRGTGPADAWGPPAQPSASGTYPGHPEYLGYPAHPPAPRRGLRTGIAVAAAVAVLAAVGISVFALSNSGGDDSQAGSTQQQTPGGQEGSGGPFGGSGGTDGQGGTGGSDGSGGTSESPAPQGSEAPKIESGSVTDSISGISLPIPDDWYGQALSVGAQVTSNSSYKCPGDTSESCTKGGAYSAPSQVLGTAGSTAEAVAKADIAANAKESYGGKTYGAITSHQVLDSKAVTVAGQKGYLVRWKAVTSKGADGYVESLAFPSPSVSGDIVVVRFGVDVGEQQSVIDTITEGIKKAAAGGTGDGQTV